MSTQFGIQPELSVANEPVQDYAPGCAKRAALEVTLDEMSEARCDLPSIIDGKSVLTGDIRPSISPHCHTRVLGEAHIAGTKEIEGAVSAAKHASMSWSQMPWEDRARIFLKTADLVAGPWRAKINAATMLGQSKSVYQAEIDAAAELIDFLRFNVVFMQRIYAEQPRSSAGVSNRIDYRPLAGFVYAITPFNFTAIASNLACAPALMGNTVVWKPSATARLSANMIMTILQEAGLPDGVINMIHADPVETSKIILSDRDLAGVHFTGSTPVFDEILQNVSASRYRNYPRLVGETGGKNFTLAHPSADTDALAVAIIRGAFEYQGQKCSATSRVFVPRSLWPALKDRLIADISSILIGDVAEMRNFMGAVIDIKAWQRLDAAIARAHVSTTETVLIGNAPDMSVGYFIPPTLIETTDINSPFLKDEFFGPIATVFVYEDHGYEDILDHIDKGSDYGLTGAVFAREADAVHLALTRLRYAAGNIYINDKSTGAVVGQQPFGGARGSGTNDKAGSLWNLARWTSPRTIKESFVSANDYRYPSMMPKPM